MVIINGHVRSTDGADTYIFDIISLSSKGTHCAFMYSNNVGYPPFPLEDKKGITTEYAIPEAGQVLFDQIKNAAETIAEI